MKTPVFHAPKSRTLPPSQLRAKHPRFTLPDNRPSAIAQGKQLAAIHASAGNGTAQMMSPWLRKIWVQLPEDQKNRIKETWNNQKKLTQYLRDNSTLFDLDILNTILYLVQEGKLSAEIINNIAAKANISEGEPVEEYLKKKKKEIEKKNNPKPQNKSTLKRSANLLKNAPVKPLEEIEHKSKPEEFNTWTDTQQQQMLALMGLNTKIKKRSLSNIKAEQRFRNELLSFNKLQLWQKTYINTLVQALDSLRRYGEISTILALKRKRTLQTSLLGMGWIIPPLSGRIIVTAGSTKSINVWIIQPPVTIWRKTPADPEKIKIGFIQIVQSSQMPQTSGAEVRAQSYKPIDNHPNVKNTDDRTKGFTIDRQEVPEPTSPYYGISGGYMPQGKGQLGSERESAVLLDSPQCQSKNWSPCFETSSIIMECPSCPELEGTVLSTLQWGFNNVPTLDSNNRVLSTEITGIYFNLSRRCSLRMQQASQVWNHLKSTKPEYQNWKNAPNLKELSSLRRVILKPLRLHPTSRLQTLSIAGLSFNRPFDNATIYRQLLFHRQAYLSLLNTLPLNDISSFLLEEEKERLPES